MDRIADATDWIEQHTQTFWLAAGLLLLALLSFAAVKVYGSVRGRDFDTKAGLAFAIVQVGVAFVMVTGTFEFFRADRWLSMPVPEAVGAAVIIEACAWVCIGMIWSHAAGTHPDPVTGQPLPNVGTGPGGYGFALVSTGGGILAIIGSPNLGGAVGRAIIVGIGVTLWWMRILARIRRANRPGKFMYSPYRLARRWGWVQVSDTDMTEDAREWQIRRLQRAMRLAAHPWRLWSWRGHRMLTRLTDQAKPDVQAEARHRYAVSHVLRKQLDPEAEAMRRVIEQAQRDLDPEPPAIEPPAPIELPAAPVEPPAAPSITPEDVEQAMTRLYAQMSRKLDELVLTPPPAPELPPVPPASPPPASSGTRTGGRPRSDEELAVNKRTEDWLVAEYTAGRSPSLMMIRRHGGTTEKPRSQNWAEARQRVARERVPALRPVAPPQADDGEGEEESEPSAA